MRYVAIAVAFTLGLSPAASPAHPAMSRAPDPICVSEPESEPICEAPQGGLVPAADERPAGAPFDSATPCPFDPPFLIPPPAAREALPRCEAFIASQPEGSAERVEALGKMALLQFLAGKGEEADATFDTAFAIDPDNRTALLAKVMVLQIRGDLAASRTPVERLRSLYPDDPQVRRAYSELMAAIGTPEQALAATENALQMSPDDLAIHQRRVQALTDLGQIDEAIAELDLVIDLIPHMGDALFARAKLELERGDATAALDDAERAKAAHFDFEEVDLLRARANLYLGNLAAALAAISDAQSNLTGPERGSPILWLYRFALLVQLGREEEAKEAVEELAGENKENVLRIQVYLRNKGFEDVQISGTFDDVTKQRIVMCLLTSLCGGPLSEFI